MSLSGVMAVTLRYFTEFGEAEFQHITASARMKLIDQMSAAITHRSVKFACVTKCMRSRMDTKLSVNQRFQRYSFFYRAA